MSMNAAKIIYPFLRDKRNKCKPEYEIDQKLRDAEHVPIRTPPYWPEYQVMEIVFGMLKRMQHDAEAQMGGAKMTFSMKRKLIAKLVGDIVVAEQDTLLNFRHHCARKREADHAQLPSCLPEGLPVLTTGYQGSTAVAWVTECQLNDNDVGAADDKPPEDENHAQDIALEESLDWGGVENGVGFAAAAAAVAGEAEEVVGLQAALALVESLDRDVAVMTRSSELEDQPTDTNSSHAPPECSVKSLAACTVEDLLSSDAAENVKGAMFAIYHTALRAKRYMYFQPKRMLHVDGFEYDYVGVKMALKEGIKMATFGLIDCKSLIGYGADAIAQGNLPSSDVMVDCAGDFCSAQLGIKFSNVTSTYNSWIRSDQSWGAVWNIVKGKVLTKDKLLLACEQVIDKSGLDFDLGINCGMIIQTAVKAVAITEKGFTKEAVMDSLMDDSLMENAVMKKIAADAKKAEQLVHDIESKIDDARERALEAKRRAEGVVTQAQDATTALKTGLDTQALRGYVPNYQVAAGMSDFIHDCGAKQTKERRKYEVDHALAGAQQPGQWTGKAIFEDVKFGQVTSALVELASSLRSDVNGQLDGESYITTITDWVETGVMKTGRAMSFLANHRYVKAWNGIVIALLATITIVGSIFAAPVIISIAAVITTVHLTTATVLAYANTAASKFEATNIRSNIQGILSMFMALEQALRGGLKCSIIENRGRCGENLEGYCTRELLFDAPVGTQLSDHSVWGYCEEPHRCSEPEAEGDSGALRSGCLYRQDVMHDITRRRPVGQSCTLHRDCMSGVCFYGGDSFESKSLWALVTMAHEREVSSDASNVPRVCASALIDRGVCVTATEKGGSCEHDEERVEVSVMHDYDVCIKENTFSGSYREKWARELDAYEDLVADVGRELKVIEETTTSIPDAQVVRVNENLLIGAVAYRNGNGVFLEGSSKWFSLSSRDPGTMRYYRLTAHPMPSVPHMGKSTNPIAVLSNPYHYARMFALGDPEPKPRNRLLTFGTSVLIGGNAVNKDAIEGMAIDAETGDVEEPWSQGTRFVECASANSVGIERYKYGTTMFVPKKQTPSVGSRVKYLEGTNTSKEVRVSLEFDSKLFLSSGQQRVLMFSPSHPVQPGRLDTLMSKLAGSDTGQYIKLLPPSECGLVKSDVDENHHRLLCLWWHFDLSVDKVTACKKQSLTKAKGTKAEETHNYKRIRKSDDKTIYEKYIAELEKCVAAKVVVTPSWIRANLRQIVTTGSNVLLRSGNQRYLVCHVPLYREAVTQVKLVKTDANKKHEIWRHCKSGRKCTVMSDELQEARSAKGPSFNMTSSVDGSSLLAKITCRTEAGGDDSQDACESYLAQNDNSVSTRVFRVPMEQGASDVGCWASPYQEHATRFRFSSPKIVEPHMKVVDRLTQDTKPTLTTSEERFERFEEEKRLYHEGTPLAGREPKVGYRTSVIRSITDANSWEFGGLTAAYSQGTIAGPATRASPKGAATTALEDSDKKHEGKWKAEDERDIKDGVIPDLPAARKRWRVEFSDGTYEAVRWDQMLL